MITRSGIQILRALVQHQRAAAHETRHLPTEGRGQGPDLGLRKTSVWEPLVLNDRLGQMSRNTMWGQSSRRTRCQTTIGARVSQASVPSASLPFQFGGHYGINRVYFPVGYGTQQRKILVRRSDSHRRTQTCTSMLEYPLPSNTFQRCKRVPTSPIILAFLD